MNSRHSLMWVLIATLASTPVAQVGAAEPAATSPGSSSSHSPSARRPADDRELRRWLENMIVHHRYSDREAALATGLTEQEIAAARRRFSLRPGEFNKSADDAGQAGHGPRIMPYPGGRHPRIGFLEGAIDPQRETKMSVFLPWDPASYVVLDVPEAIWWQNDGKRELLYLAHTHIDTTWSRQGIELPRLEWQRQPDGSWKMERRLPNGVVFGTQVRSTPQAVRLRMWLTNGTDEPLTGLAVQNCVLLKGAPRFAAQTNDNKVLKEPYIACRGRDTDHWIISAWTPCQRVWGNPPCPCMHSDPRFPDCAPGETVELRGWLSFYSGDDVLEEIRRIDASRWNQEDK